MLRVISITLISAAILDGCSQKSYQPVNDVGSSSSVESSTADSGANMPTTSAVCSKSASGSPASCQTIQTSSINIENNEKSQSANGSNSSASATSQASQASASGKGSATQTGANANSSATQAGANASSNATQAGANANSSGTQAGAQSSNSPQQATSTPTPAPAETMAQAQADEQNAQQQMASAQQMPAILQVTVNNANSDEGHFNTCAQTLVNYSHGTQQPPNAQMSTDVNNFNNLWNQMQTAQTNLSQAYAQAQSALQANNPALASAQAQIMSQLSAQIANIATALTGLGQQIQYLASSTCHDANQVCINAKVGMGCYDTTYNESPLVIDIFTRDLNAPIQLSSPFPGVLFDIMGTGKKDRISWPVRGEMFLALDRLHNGLINSIYDLFGNNTVGPDGKKAENGFAALAKYDLNHDNLIDAKDPVFSLLRLWWDKNSNGISEPGELYTLPQLGIKAIELNYEHVEQIDQYGNLTLQRSKILLENGEERTIADVWFML